MQTARAEQRNKHATENDATRHIWEATHQKTEELQHSTNTRGKTKNMQKQGKRNNKKKSLKERAKIAKNAKCQFSQHRTQSAKNKIAEKWKMQGTCIFP